MSIDISRLAFTVSAASIRFPQPIKNGHAQQLLAAVLGYRSLAAFQSSPEESPSLNDVRHLFLDEECLQRRVVELGLPHSPVELLAEIKQAFELRLPQINLYVSEDKLIDGVRSKVDRILLDKASGELAMTNGCGLDEIYLPLDFALAELPLHDETEEIAIDGHISVEPDVERPYSGHKVDIVAKLFLQKVTRNGVAEPHIEAERIKLDWSWGDDDSHAWRPLVAVLAELLEIDEDEAEELTEVEAQPITGNDDEIYGFVLDFGKLASPQLKSKILASQSTLQVRVGPDFFDTVKHDPYG